jgi:hypothetical protein
MGCFKGLLAKLLLFIKTVLLQIPDRPDKSPGCLSHLSNFGPVVNTSRYDGSDNAGKVPHLNGDKKIGIKEKTCPFQAISDEHTYTNHMSNSWVVRSWVSVFPES